MNKKSESFIIARNQYIKGYEDKNERIFPTLDLIAKEFQLTLSTLRKKAANEGWYQKRKQFQNQIMINSKKAKTKNESRKTNWE